MQYDDRQFYIAKFEKSSIVIAKEKELVKENLITLIDTEKATPEIWVLIANKKIIGNYENFGLAYYNALLIYLGVI